MIPFNDLSKNIDKQIYNATDGVTWETWDKPFGCTTAFIICIGGGGGGGGGISSSAATNRLSGGGGASSAITVAQVPFYVIPDTMYVRVGLGGAGVAYPTSAGVAGGLSYVSFYPSTSMADCLVTNSLTAAAGGGSNGYNNGGSAPAALVNSASGNPLYLSLCNWTSYAGTAGGPGGLVTGGTTTFCPSTFLNGGGGASGSSNTVGYASPNITPPDTLPGFFKTILGGLGGFTSGNGTNGGNGYFNLKPFLSLSGAGGGSSNNGIGGNGGFGMIGSGGGGGAAGATGGTGGNGGNGLVMIISF
jgi:hypothetical protein